MSQQRQIWFSRNKNENYKSQDWWIFWRRVAEGTWCKEAENKRWWRERQWTWKMKREQCLGDARRETHEYDVWRRGEKDNMGKKISLSYGPSHRTTQTKSVSWCCGCHMLHHFTLEIPIKVRKKTSVPCMMRWMSHVTPLFWEVHQLVWKIEHRLWNLKRHRQKRGSLLHVWPNSQKS